jgi:hypothetical protein
MIDFYVYNDFDYNLVPRSWSGLAGKSCGTHATSHIMPA